MIGTALRALGFFAISALLLGEGLLVLWASLGGWAAIMPGILAVLTGAGLWGLIAIEGLLGQLRRRAGSASSATQASGRGWSGWRRSSGWWPSLSPFTADAPSLKLLAKFGFGSDAEDPSMSAARLHHS